MPRREFLHDISFGLIPLGVILGIIGGLIYLQPDLSAAGTVLILGGLLFFLAGADIKQIVFLLILAVVMGWIDRSIQRHRSGPRCLLSGWLAGSDQCFLSCAAFV